MRRHLLSLILMMILPLGVLSQNATDLFFSEYVEGSSNNKYLEIFNGTGANVDLNDYQVLLFANGATTPNNTQNLTGILPSGSTIVLKNSGATIYQGDAEVSSVTNYNGNDAVALKKISTGSYVDIIGSIGEDKYWSSGDHSTQNKTLVRKPTVIQGITENPTEGFPTLVSEWDVYDIDYVEDLGKHTFAPGPPGTFSNLTLSSYALTTNQEITITWTATDIDFVKFQVRDEPFGGEWYDLEGLEKVDASSSPLPFTIPIDATDGTYVMRISDATNPATDPLESAPFTITDNHFAGLYPGRHFFPANGATDVPIDLFGVIEPDDDSAPYINIGQLLMRFAEDINPGTGNITLYKADGDVVVKTFDVNGADVFIFENEVVIVVGENLEPNTGYYVTVDNGAIVDQAITPNAFDGNVTWSFTTGASDSFRTIPEIRGTEDVPALIGQTVRTRGLVTHRHTDGKRLWIQDDDTGFNGILIYDPDQMAGSSVEVGDIITIIGTVAHYQGLAELTDILQVTIESKDNPVVPTVINLPFSEKWENMLVQINDVYYTDVPPVSGSEFEVSDGSNTGLVDDWMYVYTPSPSEQFQSIAGILNYYNEFKIAPRFAADIVSTAVGVTNAEAGKFMVAPNPVTDLLYITAPDALSTVQIISTAGSVVKEIQLNGAAQVTLSVGDLPRGLYLMRITTVTGENLISKVIKR